MRQVIIWMVIVLVLGVTGYVYWYYYNPYGDGYREGVLQKFSRKGNLFKTHEGELVLLGFGQRGTGFNANYFYFSVDDEKLADSLEECLGKTVKIHYTQYRRALPWRGDNNDARNQEKGQYVVDGIDEVSETRY